MTTIYLDKAQVPDVLRGAYSGGKFRAVVCESVTIPSDAGTWANGSRDLYCAIRTVDGAQVPLVNTVSAPWDASRQDKQFALERGIVVVKHTTFQSKDLGLTFYIRPDDAAPLLPPPAVELSPAARLVLAYSKSRKASYGGKDRYDMMVDDWRYNRMGNMPKEAPSRAQWDAAKAEMVAAGHLNKAGAITVSGKNLAEAI